MTPTLKTLTIEDIARIGMFEDNYAERFRSLRSGKDYEAYEAAFRIVSGEPGLGDEEIVRKQYEHSVRRCFRKNGKLGSLFVREVYTSREDRAKADQEAVERMRERKERKLYEKLKKKYG